MSELGTGLPDACKQERKAQQQHKRARLQNQAASSAESFTSIWQTQARSKEARKHESGALPAPRSLCCWNQAGKKTLARPPGRKRGARPCQKPAAAKPDDARKLASKA